MTVSLAYPSEESKPSVGGRKHCFQNAGVETYRALRLARTRARLSQEAVGQLFDPPITRNAVAQWEAAGGTSPDIDRLQILARAYGCTIDDLLHGPADLVEEPGGGYAKTERPPMFARTGPKPVPVVGLAVANPIEDGYFDDQQFPVGAGDGYIRWPTKDPNAYAVQVRGDSMSPRIRHGEYVVVEPNTTAPPGEDVLVRAKNGRKMVKRLLYQRGNEVSLGSINERHATLTMSLEEIESIHFVGGIAPRTAKEEP